MKRKTTTLKDLLEKKKPPEESTSNVTPRMDNAYENSEIILDLLHHSSDLIEENLFIGNIQAKLLYLETICDTKLLIDQIQEPLINLSPEKAERVKENSNRELTRLFSSSKLFFSDKWEDATAKLVDGYALLLINGIQSFCFIHVKGVSTRSIQEPTTQTIIRGPKDGFVEDISVNIGIIRNRITNPNLCFRDYYIGEDTKTKISIGYLTNIVNDKLLKEVTQRLESIQTFAIFESSNIEEMIADKTFTPFPLIYNSERPDSIASHIITGKIAIFVDGTPFVLSAPATFHDFFSVSEDYYQPFFMASLLRLIRYFSFIISLLLPSFYVAIITFHHEMIPTSLITTIISQREGLPFPAGIEALIMELTFEILREAGIRMPRAVGQTVSIVGGLVIGQAAVEAGVVSNFMVIIVALTAIASFVSPVYNLAISTRLLRFIFIILGASLGFFGIMIGLLILIGHLNSLRSFGAPYLTPIAPFNKRDQEDIFFRLPFFMMKSRPTYLKTKKPLKQYADNSPTPPNNEADKDEET